MTFLSPASEAALARLRSYNAPATNYYRLPLSRRAAVLILLFADRQGELRVVLTMRADTLKTYSGQVALPGGKADDLAETAWQTARREAFEEIGLPLQDSGLPPGFHVEHLCQLPSHLARTELGVRPTVAYLAADPAPSSVGLFASVNADPSSAVSAPAAPSVEETLIPRLDAKEVAAVFSAPFHNFLRATNPAPPPLSSGLTAKAPSLAGTEAVNVAATPPTADWYSGVWTTWHSTRWRMHNFYVPVAGQAVARPRVRKSPSRGSPSPLPYAAHREEPPVKTAQEEAEAAFRVFGMTARILVDCARVAYGEEPEFEHNAHHGDEELIARLITDGRLGDVRRKEDFEDRREDVAAASKI